jgi:hypothetical protein
MTTLQQTVEIPADHRLFIDGEIDWPQMDNGNAGVPCIITGNRRRGTGDDQ